MKGTKRRRRNEKKRNEVGMKKNEKMEGQKNETKNRRNERDEKEIKRIIEEEEIKTKGDEK